MATNPPKRQVPKPEGSVIQWLLDSDPSIRWQVLRDLTDAPAEEVAAARARVAPMAGRSVARSTGGRRSWAGAAFNQGWDSTMQSCRAGEWVLTRKRRGACAVGRSATSEWGDGTGDGKWRDRTSLAILLEGEVEPCINGQVGASGATSARTRRASGSSIACSRAAGGWRLELRAPNNSTGRRSTPRSACWKHCSNMNWRREQS